MHRPIIKFIYGKGHTQRRGSSWPRRMQKKRSNAKFSDADDIAHRMSQTTRRRFMRMAGPACLSWTFRRDRRLVELLWRRVVVMFLRGAARRNWDGTVMEKGCWRWERSATGAGHLLVWLWRRAARSGTQSGAGVRTKGRFAWFLLGTAEGKPSR